MTSINAGFSDSLYGDNVQRPQQFEGGRGESGTSYEYYVRHAPRRPHANSLMSIQRVQQTQQSSQSMPVQQQPSISTRKGENIQPYTGQIYGSGAFMSQSVESNVSDSIFQRQTTHNKSEFYKPPAHFVPNASEFSQPAPKQPMSVLQDDYINCTCCKCNGSGCMMRDPLTHEVSCRECNSNALRMQ